MMKARTIFISNHDDVSLDYLISKLSKRTNEYLRINSEDIAKIEFNICPGKEMICHVDELEIDLSSVKSVVFRRIPTKFEMDETDENRQYLNNERKHFLEGLYLTFSSAKWINPMYATQIAERKLYQLRVAQSIGLKIPSSILTNNLNAALRFLNQNKFSIIKPISNGLQVLKDRTYSIYTTEIDHNRFKNMAFSETFDTPVYLQEQIKNVYDIRVTIIGTEIYAVKITKEGNEVDWRKPEVSKTYELIQLPTKLNNLLLSLNLHLGLVYSAIDLIYSTENEYIFLEVNPVGEWVWLENELELDISNKFIQELL